MEITQPKGKEAIYCYLLILVTHKQASLNLHLFLKRIFPKRHFKKVVYGYNKQDYFEATYFMWLNIDFMPILKDFNLSIK